MGQYYGYRPRPGNAFPEHELRRGTGYIFHWVGDPNGHKSTSGPAWCYDEVNETYWYKNKGGNNDRGWVQMSVGPGGGGQGCVICGDTDPSGPPPSGCECTWYINRVKSHTWYWDNRQGHTQWYQFG